jgi:hypothetical protein
LRERAKELRDGAQDTRTNITTRQQEDAAKSEVHRWFQEFVDANPGRKPGLRETIRAADKVRLGPERLIKQAYYNMFPREDGEE